MKTNVLSHALLACLWLLLSMTTLSANRNSAPNFTLYCPDDVWVSCDAELWDLNQYGYAYTYDYGHYTYLYHPIVTYHLNSCGIGHIKREWRVKNPYGAWIKCSQLIHVGPTGSGSTHIDWPESPLHITGCNPSIHPSHLYHGYPEFHAGDCGLMGYSYHDQRFNFGPGCEKIVRTWKVIDWCSYNPNGYNHTGIWTYTQIIKISNNDVPNIHNVNDIAVSTADCSDSFVHVPDIVVSGGSCSSAFDVSHDSPFADSPYGNASGTYPVGTTTVKYTVEYGCGEKEIIKQKITVDSKAAPTPYCIYALSTALMPVDADGDGLAESGMVDIWAKDFDQGSYGACGDTDDLTFAFDSDGLEMAKTFTCDDLGVNQLSMYVIDADGNFAFCNVILTVQNNAANIQNCGADDTTDDDTSDTESDNDESETDTSHESSDDTDSQSNDDSSNDESDSSDDTEDETTSTDHEDTDESKASISGSFTWLDESPVIGQSVYLRQLTPDIQISTTLDTIIQETVVDSFYNQSGTLMYHSYTDTLISERSDTLVTQTLHQDISADDGSYAFFDLAVAKDYNLEIGTYELDYSRIDNDDAHMIYNHAIGVRPITDPYLLLAADVDRDGQVNLKDFKLVVDYLLGDRDDFTDQDALIYVNKAYDFDAANDLEDMTMSYMPSVKEKDYQMDYLVVMPGDLSGTKAKSKDRSSWLEIVPLSISAVPNPISSQSKLQIFSYENTQSELRIIDAQGRTIHQQSVALSLGYSEVSIDRMMDLPQGVYYVALATDRHIESIAVTKL